MAAQTMITILLICLAASWARERQNSRRFQWEDHNGNTRINGHIAPPAVPVPAVPRTDRKIIFINNKAYDMPEEDQDMLWYLFLNEGFVPETADFVPEPQMDSLAAALNSPGVAVVEADDRFQLVETDHNGLSEGGPGHESMKTSRLVSEPEEPRNETEPQPDAPVADPLVDPVAESLAMSLADSLAEPQPDASLADSLAGDSTESTNSTEPANTKDRAEIEVSSNDKTTEVATVKRVSILAFLWSQLTNFGGMLGRGVVDTLSDTLWTGWLNMLQMVKSRGIGRPLPEALWNSWLNLLQYVNSRELGDPLPEALWKSWLTLLQFVKSRGRRSILGLPPE